MGHKISLLYTWFVRTLLILLPDHPVVMRFRGLLYGFCMPRCGVDFQVSASAILRNLENIHVGQHVYIAPNVVINAITSITLEDEVMIGFNSVLVSGNHTLVDGSYRYGKSKVKQIIIGKGSWIAANCTVIAGTKLAEGSLLAANSSISGEFVDTGIYGGVPARKIK